MDSPDPRARPNRDFGDPEPPDPSQIGNRGGAIMVPSILRIPRVFRVKITKLRPMGAASASVNTASGSPVTVAVSP